MLPQLCTPSLPLRAEDCQRHQKQEAKYPVLQWPEIPFTVALACLKPIDVYASYNIRLAAVDIATDLDVARVWDSGNKLRTIDILMACSSDGVSASRATADLIRLAAISDGIQLPAVASIYGPDVHALGS